MVSFPASFTGKEIGASDRMLATGDNGAALEEAIRGLLRVMSLWLMFEWPLFTAVYLYSEPSIPTRETRPNFSSPLAVHQATIHL